MSKRRTISKNFNDDQILGITYDSNGKKEIHLKMGVRKKYNPGYIDYDDCHQRIALLDQLENYRELTNQLFGDNELTANDDTDFN